MSRAPLRRRRPVIAAVALGAVVAGAGIYWRFRTDLPARFAEVEPGRVYRGGYPDPKALGRLADRYGVRSVVSLMLDSPDEGRTLAERDAARALGLRLIEIPMPGDGRAEFDDLDRAADAVAEAQASGPVFFHCAAGRQRSNAVTAAYRMRRCGWGYDAAMKELEAHFGLEPGDKPDLREHLRRYWTERLAATRPATGGG